MAQVRHWRQARRRTTCIHRNEELAFEYKVEAARKLPGKVNATFEDQATALARVLTWWDIQAGPGGPMVSITQTSLMNLPVPLLNAMLGAIGADLARVPK